MRRLADLARTRLKSWMLAGRPHITQAMVGRAAGHSQAWVSNYLSGSQNADIDELDRMARVFGNSLMELVDLDPAGAERELLDAFRALRPEARQLCLQMVCQMLPGPTRGRTRRRNA